MIIGFSTWASIDILERGIIYGDYTTGTEQQIELYVTVILLGAFGHILGLIALMADCCCGAFFQPGIEVSVTEILEKSTHNVILFSFVMHFKPLCPYGLCTVPLV